MEKPIAATRMSTCSVIWLLVLGLLTVNFEHLICYILNNFLFSGLDLKAIVLLPPGEDLNDWIAVHVVDFFNRINLIYGTVSDFCTNEVG